MMTTGGETLQPRYTECVWRRSFLLVLLVAIFCGVPAEAQEEETVYRSVVPVVGHTLGIGGVEWRSQLAMTNPNQGEITVGLTLMGGDEPFFFTTLAPGQTVVLGELVGSVLGAPGVISILEVMSMGAGPVSVGVEVFGYKDGELVAQQPVPLYESALPFVSERLSGLVVSEQFRTNLGIANGGDEEAIVTLSLQRVNGRTIASVMVPIAPRSLLHSPLRKFFPLLTEGSDLTVIADVSRPEVIVYASVLSNTTHHATFIAPAPYFR